MRVPRGLVWALVVGGCRPEGAPLAPTKTADPTHGASAPVAGPDDTARPASSSDPVSAGSDPLPEKDEQRRQAGLRALDAGRLSEAEDIFADLLDRHPSNVALAGLHRATLEAIERAREQARVKLDNVRVHRLAGPPWKREVVSSIPLEQGSRPPRLTRVSSTRNAVTDDAAWFADNQLRLPLWTLPDARTGEQGTLPPEVPLELGPARLRRAISHPDHAILFYQAGDGPTIVVVLDGHGEVITALDFAAWRVAPGGIPADAEFVAQHPMWAQMEGSVLFISHGHRTYARSSGGKNAYVSALRLPEGELLWRSDPLVANAANFLVRDGFIISGYGFTAEPDFLFVLDAKTGKTVQKIKVPSGPDYILEKGDRLFVRTYDTNLEFEIR